MYSDRAVPMISPIVSGGDVAIAVVFMQEVLLSMLPQQVRPLYRFSICIDYATIQ